VIVGWPWLGLKDFFHGWSDSVLQTTGLPTTTPGDAGVFIEMLVPIAVVAGGMALAYLLYWGRATDPLDVKVLAHKFYIDEFYDRSIGGGHQMAARFINWIDSWVLNGLIVRGSAYVSVAVGEVLRLFQTGSLQGYAFLFSLGGVILIYFTLFSH
jgi:NADH-quinone oxidoreductase subunit L